MSDKISHLLLLKVNRPKEDTTKGYEEANANGGHSRAGCALRLLEHNTHGGRKGQLALEQ